MTPRPGHPPPLLLPRILKLIIHYIDIFVSHLKHIGLPNLEKFVQWPKHFNPPSEKNSGFAPGNNLHVVLGLSSFSIRFSSHASRIFSLFTYVATRTSREKCIMERTTLNAPNIQQPMLGVLFKNCLWELWYMYIGLFDIKF